MDIRMRRVCTIYLLLLAIVGTLLPAPLAAAPTSIEPLPNEVVTITVPSPQANTANAPLACPISTAGLPDRVESNDFCVYFDSTVVSNTQAGFVADQTQDYWDRYVELGFLPPRVGIDKLKVYIRNEAQCNGVTSNAWNRIEVNSGCFSSNLVMQYVVGHELFHRVEYSYDSGETKWFKEGTARAMQDKTFAVIDAINSAFASYHSEANQYLLNTNNDITSEPMRYESALWWGYFMEQFGSDPDEPELGVDAMTTLWQAAEDEDDIAAVNVALSNLGTGLTFDEAFRTFSAANWIKRYDNAPAEYDYIDDEQGPVVRPFFTPFSTAGLLSPTAPLTALNEEISRYGVKYYRAIVSSSCQLVTATATTVSGPAFFHLVTGIGATANLLDYHESSTASTITRSFYNTDLSEVIIIAGSTYANAEVDIAIQCINPQLTLVAPNNSLVAKVGRRDNPGEFLVKASVTNGSPTGPVVSGLRVNNFRATVNGQNAPIYSGGFIQQQYWLVVQAPTQSADGLYELGIDLIDPDSGNLLDSESSGASVEYGEDSVDHILVVDRSGSMGEDGKLTAAKDAASAYIDITRDDNGLAVLPFNQNVTAPFALQNTNGAARSSANLFVGNLTAAGGTSIGDGLQEAIAQRVAAVPGNERCSVVLLSDGIETADERWSDVRTGVVASDCTVQTIAFGPETDESLLQEIANLTGGSYLFNDVYVTNLQAAADNSGNGGSGQTAAAMHLKLADKFDYLYTQNAQRERFWAEVQQMPAGVAGTDSEQRYSVTVDEKASEAMFLLDWPSIAGFGELALKVILPNGTEMIAATHPYTFQNLTQGHLGWRIDKPQAGNYTLIVSAAKRANQPVDYQLLVSAKSPRRVHLLLPGAPTGYAYLTGEEALIAAALPTELQNGRAEAEVIGPDGSLTLLALYDDGRHGDGWPNDGFYANFYTQVNQANTVQPFTEPNAEPSRPLLDEGSYQVRLRVRGDNFQREALGAFVVRESLDSDKDGLPDAYEERFDVADASGDPDLDGLTTATEYELGTDPTDSDSDNGGENDGSEVAFGQNPRNSSDDQIAAPAFLAVAPNIEFNEVRYHVRAEYTNLKLYRTTDPTGKWEELRDAPPKDGYHEDKAANETTYWYRYLAVNAGGHESALLPSAPVTPSKDPFIPEAAILINGGAPTTSDFTVQLSFIPRGHDHEDAVEESHQERFGDIVELRIDTDPEFPNGKWQKFEPTLTFKLEPVEKGLWTEVYAQFRDDVGNESLIALSSILYQPGGSFGDDEATIYLPFIAR